MTNKFKGSYLETISNPIQIRNHQLNDSKTKQLFSFGKARRFPNINHESACKKLCYDSKPFYHNTRSCSLGYGRKYDFTQNKENTPGPQKYDKNYYDIMKRVEKKGITFGLSRDKCLNNPKEPHLLKKYVPGPGTYAINDYYKQKKGYSFRIKHKKRYSHNRETGPGRYNIKSTIGLNASLNLTQFKNKGNTIINPLPKSKALRNQQLRTNKNFYDLRFQINKEGKYFNSKYRNTCNGFFSKSKRSFILQRNKNKYIGPGCYVLPSDFGIYQSSTVKRS